MNHPPYNQAEFNALVAAAKVRAVQLRREAMSLWGTHLVRFLQGLTPQTKSRKSPCPT